MYPPHHLGGYELMWRSFVWHMREWGHEVRVLTTGYRAPDVSPSTPEDEGVFRDLRWYWHDHAFPRLSPAKVVALERDNAATLRRHVEDHRPEVVSWWAMGGMSLSLLEQARRAGLPAVSAVVDDWLLYGPDVDAWSRMARHLRPLAPAIERLVAAPVRIDLERSAEWVFASETLRRHARDRGWRMRGAAIAHPGIDQQLFAAPREERLDWGWKLLYCGRIDERKGIDTAIEALPHLPAEATLTVLGGGDDEHLGELRRLAGRLGVADRVSFARRPREQLPAAYAQADATLFPVRWEEPFGLVPLESMATGTPVVATGRGGSSEYLRDGENCVLFDCEAGAPALAGAVRRLATDCALRRRLRAAGIATASRFSTEGFDRAIEAALERAATPAA
jgi:glycosyltransferase involved in cell wall biosynthesis